jgi:hypothetical protein
MDQANCCTKEVKNIFLRVARFQGNAERIHSAKPIKARHGSSVPIN